MYSDAKATQFLVCITSQRNIYLFTCLFVSFTQSVQQSEKNDQSNIWSSQKKPHVFFLCEMDISHYLHSVTVIIS